jgi:hypothetical protein
MAKPKGKGSAVPRIREVPAVAIVAWVMDIKAINTDRN